MTDRAETAFASAIRAQALAARPDRSAWVEAHAGSGKTKVLIDRVARLLLRREDGRRGADPDTILCITYTKAAANEMLPVNVYLEFRVEFTLVCQTLVGGPARVPGLPREGWVVRSMAKEGSS